jgi:hypothetical protein
MSNGELNGVRSRKLSNFGRVSDGGPKMYYLELLCAPEAVKPLVPAAFAVVSTHVVGCHIGPAWRVIARSPYV